ncbi:hypothetical protein MAR_005864 [Mya arenaria]|uniref:Endonuclease/exonuclease/phosphatase domain-containing protein n=1 Tax=Mya arenaria TaxID=6604 RepID=A0ABY7DU18_MYAAR|nr:hypothetical protein MAR_022823 [Mya arenaria]WAR15759.1 hypothetical protein MAR_005864 [Mya arenaria]
MGISETKFNENHKTETFHIDGYQVPLRRDRLFNGGGGLAVYVKQNVNCIRRLDLEGDDIEIIWLEIMPTKCKSFLIGSLYRHPESKVAWKEIFDTHIENVQLEEKEIIILGDINRDLLNSEINDEWSSYILSLGLKQLIKQPTRESSTSKTLIDHIYTNCDQNICNVSVPKIGISDHYPILCTRKLNYKEKINSHNFIKYRSFRSFSEESFLSDLIRIPWDVSKATGLDQIGPTLLKLSADVISNSLTYVINCSIKQGDKILGIYINENLKWDTHIKFLRKKISSNLWLLSRIKVFIPVNYRIMFYKAYVQPHLDYCSIIWGSTKQSNIQVLVRLQRRACRIILGEQYTTLSEALNIINSLNIEQRVSLHKAKFMYRVSQNAVPSYIQNMFNYNVRRPNHLRSSNKSDFLIPKPNIELFKGSMSYSGVKVWNNIPNEIRQSESIKSFTVNYTKWINSNQQS